MARTYSQLDLGERRTLFRLVNARRPVGEIADQLGRHRSTIYREIARNEFREVRQIAVTTRSPPRTAPAGVAAGSASCPRRDLRGHVVEKLRPLVARADRRSLEASRRGRACATRPSTSSSTARKDGRWSCTVICSRQAAAAAALRPQARSPKIPLERTIAQRPAEIRRAPGHRALGGRPADLPPRPRPGQRDLARRAQEPPRLLIPNHDRRSARHRRHRRAPGAAAAARQTITFDRGSEFLGYADLDRHRHDELLLRPALPWQKGSVENTNGRLRRFLPGELEPEALAHAHLRRLADRLNDTPRRCLGYRTPREVFQEHLAAPDGPP